MNIQAVQGAKTAPHYVLIMRLIWTPFITGFEYMMPGASGVSMSEGVVKSGDMHGSTPIHAQ